MIQVSSLLLGKAVQVFCLNAASDCSPDRCWVSACNSLHEQVMVPVLTGQQTQKLGFPSLASAALWQGNKRV